MNILLFGEYSGFYNSLKSGLLKNGHNVLLSGRSDQFKNYPLDISLEPRFLKSKLPNIFRQAIYRLTKFDIADIEVYLRFLKHKKHFKGYDVVQLINEFPFQIHQYLESKMLKFIFKHNKNVFLSACGNDTIYVDFINNYKGYTPLTPYKNNPELKPYFKYTLQFLNGAKKHVHNLVFKHIKAVIPGDMDYVMAYEHHDKVRELIPFPVNLEKLKFTPLTITDKVVIFHGINRVNYYKKGNDVFEKALEIVKKKHSNNIEILTVENLPYNQYIESYNKAHILLDQVYGYDQGYNALEAMAKGKAVFTGAEKNWQDHYKVEADTIAINATPNAEEIAKKLELLIENPERIINISTNARKFIEEEHDCKKVAQKYVSLWQSFNLKC